MASRARQGSQPVAVSDALVRALIKDQFPDLAGLEIGRHYALPDRVGVRLGDAHGAILPLTDEIADAYAESSPWIGKICSPLSFPVSIPQRMGSPTEDYPYHWFVVNWFDASTSAVVPLEPAATGDFARALRELHSEAPQHAHDSRVTSAPLASYTNEFEELIDLTGRALGPDGQRVDVDTARADWTAGVAAEVDLPRSWTHGALSPLTVLSQRGKFAAICDWHYLGAGDPAADIAAATLLIPAETAAEGTKAYGRQSESTRARILAYRHIYILRAVISGNPFLENYGWNRIADAALLREATGRPGHAKARGTVTS